MPTFPANLRLIRDGYGEKPDPNVDRSEMDAGPPKQAPKSSRHLVARDLQYLAVSRADYAAFRAWFRADIAQGSAWFDWVDPFDGVTRSARIRGGAMEARADGLDANAWVISVTIETWSGA